MTGTKYDKVAERKDHSDTLYYNILAVCIVVNSAFGASAGALVKDMSGYRDCGLLIIISIAGLVLTNSFNRYLRNEKTYQRYLRDYFDANSDEFTGYPDIFERSKEMKADSLQARWSSITKIIATFWWMVFCFGLGVALRIYHG